MIHIYDNVILNKIIMYQISKFQNRLKFTYISNAYRSFIENEKKF